MSDPPSIAPFPFETLPRISREEVHLQRRLRSARRRIRLDRLAEELSDLVGGVVRISTGRARMLEASNTLDAVVAVGFAPAEAPTMAKAVCVAVELSLANTLVSRALRQRIPRVTAASRPPGPEISGAFAALLHAGLRRAYENGALSVISAGPAPALLRDLAAAHHRVAIVPLTVLVDGASYSARIAVPVSHLPTSAPSLPVGLTESLFSETPIALPVVLTTCVASRAELAGLREGDAFVLPPATTADLRVENGMLVGPVVLVAPRSERGLTGVLSEGAVLRTGAVASIPWDRPRTPVDGALEKAESRMAGEISASPAPTLEVLEDAPIVVRVELGVVEMRAREWAHLGPGDVVALGKKLGDPVTLRVGGVEIARGELVQIDGEYGVRILASATGRNGGT